MTIFGVAPKSGSAASTNARRDGIWALTLQNVDVPILVIEPHLTAAARNFAADRVRPDLAADIAQTDRAVPRGHSGAAFHAPQIHAAETGLHGRGLAHRITRDRGVLRPNIQRLADAGELHRRERGAQLRPAGNAAGVYPA